MANAAQVISIDPSLITLTPSSSLCPAIKLKVTNWDDTELNPSLFSFNSSNNQFAIDTQDLSYVDRYDVKLVASFSGESYAQVSEHPFTVVLIDYCAGSTLTDPGQSSFIDYYYEGTSTFNLIPFTVMPDECHVDYVCYEPFYRICNYTVGTTVVSFDSNTGDFSFTSSDIETFGTQSLFITITGFSGNSTESFSFDLNLIDLCEVATINIDPTIVR